VAQPTHVIIADDEDSIRMVLTRYVAQTYPGAVAAVADGQAALTDTISTARIWSSPTRYAADERAGPHYRPAPVAPPADHYGVWRSGL
jgi:spore germination cell wall hydrolase CwlJ-like protein